jgi:hypothetical protein
LLKNVSKLLTFEGCRLNGNILSLSVDNCDGKLMKVPEDVADSVKIYKSKFGSFNPNFSLCLDTGTYKYVELV